MEHEFVKEFNGYRKSFELRDAICRTILGCGSLTVVRFAEQISATLHRSFADYVQNTKTDEL